MGQNFITATIGWKLATLLAVVGGGLALGGSFYMGKKVGSSKPPTVIRMPPRMMPMPVVMDPVQANSQEGEANSAGASPATDTPSSLRPSRFKKLPLPVSREPRSQAADAPDSQTDKT